MSALFADGCTEFQVGVVIVLLLLGWACHKAVNAAKEGVNKVVSSDLGKAAARESLHQLFRRWFR